MRVGLIGCGNVSLNLHLPACQAEPGIEVVAAADLTPARLALFRERSGLGQEVCFTDASELLNSDNVDAVLVATPPRYRPPIVHAALAAGKHVLSEKPIALTPADAWSMASAAKSSGATLAMVHNYYFMPELAAVKRILDAGTIGAPYLVTLNFLGVEDRPGAAEYRPVWRHDASVGGGGVLMDMLHAVYMLVWLAGGQPVRSVSADVDHRRADAVEDVALCRFRFDNGFGLINMAWGQGPGGVEVMGSDGRLLLFYRNFGTGPFEPPEQIHVYRGGECVEVDYDPLSHRRFGMQPVWRDFAESVEQRRPPIADAEQGCATLEAVIAAYASAARSRTVSLPLAPADSVYYRGIAALLGQEQPEEVIAGQSVT